MLKKRSVDKNSLRDRWLRIAEQNGTNVIAIIRQRGNILKFLNCDAWDTFTENMKVPDDSILSIHCFVKSKKHTIYRNNFEVKDRTGRFVTTTYCYCYEVDEQDPETVTVFHEDSAKVYECKAGNICSIMDLATNTIIKYVETMLGVKVLSLSVDYVIDSKSQLWMLWTSNAKILVSGADLADETASNLPSGDRRGRMSWAGPKYFEAENDEKFRQAQGGGVRQDKPVENISFDSSGPLRLDVGMASSQIISASNVVDEHSHEVSGGSVLVYFYIVSHDDCVWTVSAVAAECFCVCAKVVSLSLLSYDAMSCDAMSCHSFIPSPLHHLLYLWCVFCSLLSLSLSVIPDYYYHHWCNRESEEKESAQDHEPQAVVLTVRTRFDAQRSEPVPQSLQV